jgi:hypothetical protein
MEGMWAHYARSISIGREAGRPPPKPSGAPLRSGAFWCLPESDDVCFVVDKFRSFYAIQSSFFSFLK